MRRLVFLGAFTLALLGCDPGTDLEKLRSHGFRVQDVTVSAAAVEEILKLSPLPVTPPDPTNRVADDESAAWLGRFLFHDKQLSARGDISCATCHRPDLDFADGRERSEGIGLVTRNAPTLWNVAHQRWFFWDGRSDSLWSQSLAPLEHPLEMGTSRLDIYRRIESDPELRKAYEGVFGPLPGISSAPAPEEQRGIDRVFVNVGKSIAAFERTLESTDATFDRFVLGIRRGDSDEVRSFSAAALRGLVLFVGRGECTLCHSGPLFSDREFHNIGLDRGAGDLDTGRFDGIPLLRQDPFIGTGEFSDDRSDRTNAPTRYVVQKPNNLGEFRTPTLRNVAKTAPYMHDGRFATLEQVMTFYSTLPDEPALGHREETLKPLALTTEEIADLVAFLGTLTGATPDPGLLRPPDSPVPLDRR